MNPLNRRVVAILAPVLSLTAAAQAQTWQEVWGDEFNGSIGPDWVYDIGRGSSGWGNNELEYYRQENATIENNALVITAKKEAFGGANYTSARLKTQGKKSWHYGKMVARIQMPAFQGSWPGFWMLGDNIGAVGWPQCGEIDIMEQINTIGTVYGSTHWYSGGQADFSGNTGASVTAFHEYSVQWDNQYIKWFVDGIQYNQFFIGNNSGNTNAFNDNYFFLLLNMAVGGNWPGNTINDGALPAKMIVDYVRVYQSVGEAESMRISAASDTVDVVSESGYSNGEANILRSNAAGDSITYVVPNVAAGTYSVSVGMKKNPSRGQFQLSASRADQSTWTNIGGVIDEYSSNTGGDYVQVNVGTWTPSSTNDKLFKLAVTAKNGSADQYWLSIDYIRLTKQ